MNEDDWIDKIRHITGRESRDEDLKRQYAEFDQMRALIPDPLDYDEAHMDLPNNRFVISKELLESAPEMHLSPKISEAIAKIYDAKILDSLMDHAEFARLMGKDAPMDDEAYLKACDAVLAAVVHLMDNRDDETLRRMQAALAPETSTEVALKKAHAGSIEEWAKTLTKKQIEEKRAEDRRKRTESFAYYHPTATEGADYRGPAVIHTSNASNTSNINTSWTWRADRPREKGTA